jgi:hypothetical protein
MCKLREETTITNKQNKVSVYAGTHVEEYIG